MNNEERSLTKKERKALRREEKAQAHVAEKRKRTTKTILFVASTIVILGMGGWFTYGWISTRTPGNIEGPDQSQAIPILDDKNHIHSDAPRPEYNSNPPTSGPHHGKTNERGVHEEEAPDELMVHNLEHGEVWISYQPDVSASVVEELKDITNSYRKVVLTPRAGNDKDIALAAWGRLDTFDVNSDGTIDRSRIESFIKRYRNKGPEQIP